MSDDELAKIRAGLTTGLPLRPHPSIVTGTRVRVQNGAFAGVEGIVTELRKQSSVVITLSATHQCFSLEVCIDDLSVLGKSSEKSGIVRSPHTASTLGKLEGLAHPLPPWFEPTHKRLLPVGHPDVLHLRGVLQEPAALGLGRIEPVVLMPVVRPHLLHIAHRGIAH